MPVGEGMSAGTTMPIRPVERDGTHLEHPHRARELQNLDKEIFTMLPGDTTPDPSPNTI
jgi:hypothetical protein